METTTETTSPKSIPTSDDQLFLVGVLVPIDATSSDAVIQAVVEYIFSIASGDLTPDELGEAFAYELIREGSFAAAFDLSWRSVPAPTPRMAINRVMQLLEEAVDVPEMLMVRVQPDPSDAPAAAMTKIWPTGQ